jgi:signal transduction histidine kinase
LINNAIKYNREGGFIKIENELDLHNFIIKISDSGIGISPENIPGIFDRFTKIESSGSEGFGLGLSIVKSIADFHQLKIEVASQIEKGSTFSVLFPLKYLKAEG